LLRLQEVEELALPVEVGERRAPEQAHEVVAVQRVVDAVLEIFLAGRVVVGIGGVHALQPREDVAGDLDRVERLGPDVRVTKHMDVALGAGEARGDVEEWDAGVRRHVSRSTLIDLRIVRLVEQRGDPELEIEAGSDEEVCARQRRHEARLGLDVVGVLVADGDRADRAAVSHDLAGDSGIRGERSHHLDRRRRRSGGARGGEAEEQRKESQHGQ